ncbi:MAG: methyltransferase domain-containing protein, partial [Phycisphaeraceae bacterium]
RLEQRLTQRPDARAFFAGAAGEWDRLRAEYYGDHFTTAALAALVPSHWTIADLGCGTGQLLAEFAPNVKQILGIDNSPAMLKAAAKRTASLGNVELREGELDALPIEDASCDAALLVLVLTYIEEPPRVLAEMRRILRPGGKAVIIDLLLHDREDFRRDMQQRWPGFDAAALVDDLQHAGFAQATCRALPPVPEAKGPALILATAT